MKKSMQWDVIGVFAFVIGLGSLIILIATGGTFTIGGITYGSQMTLLIPVLSAFGFMFGFMCLILGYFESKKEARLP